jgi:hypothetical protein
MIITNNPRFGKEVKVWNDGYSNDWTYHIRNVKVLNSLFDEVHPKLQELADREARIERKLLLLLFSMENVFRMVYTSDDYSIFDRWESHNRMNFNRWYHDQIHDLIDEINKISMEYADLAFRDGYGYCF